MPKPRRFIGYRTAALLVVANMIGTGVFTTLGLQAAAVPNGAALLLLWGLGALVALCGALSYAELAASVPRSGGEYHFLSRIYHPALGRLAGLVSVVVGFAAPVALAAMALGRYAGIFLYADPLWIAVSVIVIITALHAVEVEIGRGFQVIATLVKVAVILLFAAAAIAHGTVPGSLSPLPTADTLAWVFSAPFGLSLIYVSYAYAGWNAAAYVVDEVSEPEKTVPRALTHGTLAVAAIYLLLVSTISAMVLAGPRVLRTMGEDIPALRGLSACNYRGAPTRAILLQQGLALAFVLTNSFEGVLTFAGFTLALFSCLTVAGVFRLRAREPALLRPFRIPLYPLPPLLFLLVNGLALLAVIRERPQTALAVLALLVLGGLLLNPNERA